MIFYIFEIGLNNMKKILITGGEGFIGANFIKYMIDKYKDIIVFLI